MDEAEVGQFRSPKLFERMKCFKRVIDAKTGTGFVKLEAQDVEDMWHVYVSEECSRRNRRFRSLTCFQYPSVFVC